MRKREQCANLTVVLATVLILPTAVWVAGLSLQAQESVVRFGLSPAVVEADVNPDDALAATRVWAASIGSNSGLWNAAEAVIFRDLPSLVASVNRGATDIVAISTQEQVEAEGILRAEPCLTYLQAGQVELEYLVIVRRDSTYKTLQDLRGKRVAFAKGGRNSMVLLWADALLAESGLPSRDTFFREIKEVQKPSQVILPVFFKQLDAGITIRSVFDTAVTLNPQIGQQVKALASSPRLVPLVVCMRSGIPTTHRMRWIDRALVLHETPNGLQTFNVFKIDRLVRWEPRFVDNVKELMRKQKLGRSNPLAQKDSNLP